MGELTKLAICCGFIDDKIKKYGMNFDKNLQCMYMLEKKCNFAVITNTNNVACYI